MKEFDALFIPGGYSPDKLRVDHDAVRFVKAFVASVKLIFSIYLPRTPAAHNNTGAPRAADNRLEVDHPG